MTDIEQCSYFYVENSLFLWLLAAQPKRATQQLFHFRSPHTMTQMAMQVLMCDI
jgi:hypothetical protein